MISQRSQSAIVSISVHTGIVALLLLASNQLVPVVLKKISPVSTSPLIAPRLSTSGGGGMRQLTPASQGRAPKSSPRVFVPPMIEVVNQNPKLAMTPTIDAPPQVDRTFTQMGDPLSKFAGTSAGMGGPLGIGNHGGGGIGDKDGASIGSGAPGLTVYPPGKGVTIPVLIYRVEPEFSEEARKSKHSGTVMVRIDVDANGIARNIRVVQTLGMGLDEKAVEAVSKWRFKPGTKDGKPVAVSALVEVMFHLL